MTDLAAGRSTWAPDRWLTDITPDPGLRGLRRFCVEFLFFGLKEARACLFAGLFFVAIFARAARRPCLRSAL